MSQVDGDEEGAENGARLNRETREELLSADRENVQIKTERSCLVRALEILNVSNHLSRYFTKHGQICASHPKKVIALSFLLVGLASLGMLNFHWESNAIKLWIPENSDFARDYNYLWSKYPPDLRFQSAIFVAPDGDVLQPKYIQQMYRVYQKLNEIRVTDNRTWSDFCFKIPIVKVDASAILGKRRKRQSGDEFNMFEDDFGDDFEIFDPSVAFYPNPYCRIVEALEEACFEFSILELWAVNGAYTNESDLAIANLTKQDILDKINSVNMSGLFMVERDYKPLLGGVKMEEGKIISAAALELKLIGKMNGTAAREEEIKIDNALGEYVEAGTLEFEKEVIDVFLEANQNEAGLEVFINVARSFNDIASETILTDTTMVVLGFSIVFTYVILMLGKFSLVNNRVILSWIGLSSIGMTIFASYGLCCSLGFAFSPLHNFIPFLILGLGIDDMFVIMQSWNNLDLKEKQLETVKKFGLTLGRSGVAITVTSLTDILAFGVGATTILPALKSFCVFCAMGIFIVFLLQSTWFVAWMAIDQSRIEATRNGCFPCIKHKATENQDEAVCNGSEKSVMIQSNCGKVKKMGKSFTDNVNFDAYAKILLKTPVQAVVILITLTILAISLWGNVELRQEFDPMWFLPRDSYLARWSQMNKRYFPSQGEKVHIFATEMNLPSEMAKLDSTLAELQNQTDIITSIDSWFLSFKSYYNTNFERENGPLLELDKESYREKLTQFLFSPSGAKYRSMFKYDGEIRCGQPAPNISMFTMDFTHRLFDGPREQIPAMNRVKAILEKGNFSGTTFPFSKGYAAWETDEVIAMELYRNLALALGCIFLTTLILLSSFLGCLQVVACVLLTLTNVAGFMHFWGLTIETVSSTNLIISIGLCVDCPAHITHEFLAVQGSRVQRAQEALRKMGPAVLNGGFSTFLSFILLANSNSHVFETFFKIFFLVVVFAMYNGLVVLPVILSHFGPPAASHFSAVESIVLVNGDNNVKERAYKLEPVNQK